MIATFLAALMWRGLANSVTLSTTTHRKMGKMSDGTGTQVKAPMFDKCKVLMTSRGYIREGSPYEEGMAKKRRKRREQRRRRAIIFK